MKKFLILMLVTVAVNFNVIFNNAYATDNVEKKDEITLESKVDNHSNSQNINKEDVFVNKLFNQVLRPLSTNAWRANLSHDKIIFDNKGGVIVRDCNIFENASNYVIFICKSTQDGYPEQDYKFEIIEHDKLYGGWLVRGYFKSPLEKEFVNRSSYIIADPK